MVTNAISRELFRNFWLGHNPAWLENDFANTSYPRYNIVEGKAGFTIEVAVPGWSKKDLKVVVKDNELRIKGSRDDRGGDSYLHQGLSTKSFDKVFVLNNDLKVEQVKLLDGLLTITIERDRSAEVNFDIK